MSEQPRPPAIDAADVRGIRGALLRYRVMAWVVGVLLVVLITGTVLRLLVPSQVLLGQWIMRNTGVLHGYLYMVLLITAFDLGRRVKWSLKWFLAIMFAGTVPFLSFVAEHYATRDVRARLAAAAAD